jgi:hypothetical protein
LRLLLTADAAILLVAFTVSPARAQQPSVPEPAPALARAYLGFDRNAYPGDAALPELRKLFSFTGYWLTNPPLETQNTWTGKRDILLRNGFGFLVLANGRLYADILSAAKQGSSPAALGRKDAAAAAAAAHREGFPPGTILFLDQEQGGRLLPEQAGWHGPRLSHNPPSFPACTPAASPSPTAATPAASPSPLPQFKTFASVSLLATCIPSLSG